MKKNEQGRSMIEMMGVLAIIGVLSVGGLSGYRTALNKLKTNKLVDTINTITANAKATYSSQRNYRGLNNRTAALMDILPRDVIDKQSNTTASEVNAINSFAGTIKIEATTINGKENEGFMVAVDSIPSSACYSLVTIDWNSNDDSFQGIYVDPSEGNSVDTIISSNEEKSPKAQLTSLNNTDSTDDSETSINGSKLINTTDAQNICGANKMVTIAWKFI